MSSSKNRSKAKLRRKQQQKQPQQQPQPQQQQQHHEQEKQQHEQEAQGLVLLQQHQHLEEGKDVDHEAVTRVISHNSKLLEEKLKEHELRLEEQERRISLRQQELHHLQEEIEQKQKQVQEQLRRIQQKQHTKTTTTKTAKRKSKSNADTTAKAIADADSEDLKYLTVRAEKAIKRRDSLHIIAKQAQKTLQQKLNELEKQNAKHGTTTANNNTTKNSIANAVTNTSLGIDSKQLKPTEEQKKHQQLIPAPSNDAVHDMPVFQMSLDDGIRLNIETLIAVLKDETVPCSHLYVIMDEFLILYEDVYNWSLEEALETISSEEWKNFMFIIIECMAQPDSHHFTINTSILCLGVLACFARVPTVASSLVQARAPDLFPVHTISHLIAFAVPVEYFFHLLANVLFWCYDTSVNPQIQEFSKVLGFIIRGMQLHQDPDDGNIQHLGCMIFGLLALVDEDKITQIAKEGAVKAIVQAMKTYPNEEQLMASACYALHHLADDESNHNTKLILKKGAVPLILQAMRMWLWNGELQRDALKAIAHLSDEIPKEKMSVKKEIVPLIVEAMRNHPKNPNVQVAACEALWSDYVNRDDFVDKGGIDLIIQAMTNHPKSPRIQDFACVALSGIASREGKYRPKIVEAGVIPLIVKAIKNHAKDSMVQNGALMLFAVLYSEMSVEKDRKKLEKRSIALILETMKEHIGDPNVQSIAVHLLWKMVCESVANRRTFVRKEGPRLVLVSMKLHPSVKSTIHKSMGLTVPASS